MIGYKNMIEIKEIPNYYIDIEGTIYSKLSNKIIKPFISNNTKQIRLKKSKVYNIADLVSKQFLPFNEQCIYGNSLNTHVTNLKLIHKDTLF